MPIKNTPALILQRLSTLPEDHLAATQFRVLPANTLIAVLNKLCDGGDGDLCEYQIVRGKNNEPGGVSVYLKSDVNRVYNVPAWVISAASIGAAPIDVKGTNKFFAKLLPFFAAAIKEHDGLANKPSIEYTEDFVRSRGMEWVSTSLTTSNSCDVLAYHYHFPDGEACRINLPDIDVMFLEIGKYVLRHSEPTLTALVKQHSRLNSGDSTDGKIRKALASINQVLNTDAPRTINDKSPAAAYVSSFTRSVFKAAGKDYEHRIKFTYDTYPTPKDRDTSGIQILWKFTGDPSWNIMKFKYADIICASAGQVANAIYSEGCPNFWSAPIQKPEEEVNDLLERVECILKGDAKRDKRVLPFAAREKLSDDFKSWLDIGYWREGLDEARYGRWSIDKIICDPISLNVSLAFIHNERDDRVLITADNIADILYHTYCDWSSEAKSFFYDEGKPVVG